jgi:tol-pal system protein YbgF
MEMVRADAAQRQALASALALLQAASDSIMRVSARTVSIQGDVRGETRAIREQLLQVQSLLGQSQANILRLREGLERAQSTPVVPPAPPAGTVPPAGRPPADSNAGAAPPPDASGPGPAALYNNGLALLRKGSTSTARSAFQELLLNFPTSDLAPAAQFYIGQSLEREKNIAGADAAYAAVVAKYPASEQAPTALYKRALLYIGQGNGAAARPLLEQVIARYPKSDEAERAAEQLKTLR